MERLRRSAAVVLTRGRGEELEVYLVERAPELRFFGGYWAFPGGVADAQDRRDGDAGMGAALERAALRELFEETGLLVGPLARAIPVRARDELRRLLLAGSAARGPFGGSEELEEARRSLRRVCEITTPPFAAVRHRTPFFHLELPLGQAPQVVPGELVRGAFFRPAELWRRWLAGELAVVPPALYLLELLIGRELEDFFPAAARAADELAAGSLHRVRFSPGVLLAPLRTPTIPPATTTNTLLVGHERVYVVDPATPEPEEQARLFETMDRWLAEGRRFEGVLLTHHHRDHVGAVAPLRARYGLQLLAHPETFRRLGESLRGPGAVRALEGGERLDLGPAPDGAPDWGLHVHFTPGHAPGHLVFQEDRYGALIAGDLVSTLSTIVIDPADGHMATYLDSLRAARALEPRTLYPAHGPAHRDGAALLDRFLAHRREREQRLVGALGKGLTTVAELLPVVYSDTAPEQHPLAALSLRSGLDKLVEEGLARDDGGRWTLVVQQLPPGRPIGR